MTGPFVRVQESKLHGPTWVNVARIVKIQRTSSGTSIVVEGAGTMHIDEPAEALVGRLDEALANQAIAPRPAARPPNGVRRGRAKTLEAQHD